MELELDEPVETADPDTEYDVREVSDSDDDNAADARPTIESETQDSVTVQCVLSQELLVLFVMDMQVAGLHTGTVQLAASAVSFNSDVMSSFL